MTEERGNKFESGKESDTEKIQLNHDMVLEEKDIESRVPVEELPRETIAWKAKEGFPSYHLNPETRLLIVFLPEGTKAFRLSEDSHLLRKYMEKYMQKHVLKNDGGLYLS